MLALNMGAFPSWGGLVVEGVTPDPPRRLERCDRGAVANAQLSAQDFPA